MWFRAAVTATVSFQNKTAFMPKFIARFFLPAVVLLSMLALFFLYFHNEKEKSVAILHQQDAMRNINEKVYDIVRVNGDKHFNDSCALQIDEYVSQYRKRGLRVTLIEASTGNVIYESSAPGGVAANHGDRPEVVQAIEKGDGYDVRRLSSVVDEEFFYVASSRPGYDFVVRTSMPYEIALQGWRNDALLMFAVAGIIIMLVLLIIYRIIKLARGAELATQKLLQHLRTSQEGVAIFNSKRRMIFANPLFSEYADFISSKHLGRVEDVLVQPEFSRIKRFIDNEGYFNNSVQETMVTDVVELSGRIFALRGVLFRDKGFEISINDITAAEEQSRLKRQLTQNVAHEFKTPVCGIQGYLETILQNYPDNMTQEQLMHFLERCHSQSNRLSTLVQDISQLNEMTSAVQKANKEQVDLSRVVARIFNEVGEKMDSLGMSADNRLPASLIVNADPSMLYSIFRNLIDNAMAYAGKGTTVTVACIRSDEQFFYFTFSDNGAGVADEHLPRLFERFYRVDKGRSRKLGGTGLGLAIVKNAVALHGGTISARRAQGGGLEFVFKLQK